MQICKRHWQSFCRTTVRCLLLLLALSSFDALQLVLCHEEGRAPRLEQAFNGQCLNLADDCCQESRCGLQARTATGYAQDSLHQLHRHCGECSDSLLHARHLQRAAAVAILDTAAIGGCLFVLPAAGAGQLPISGSRKGQGASRQRMPQLAILHCESQHLLI